MNTARLNQGTPLLLNAVSKHYAENIVLNQLDLHIPAGQFVAVVGRSGGGKSTLLRLLAGLETPTAGDVLAGTTPLAEIQEDTRMMFQDARLLPWKSVIDNVGLGLKGQWRDAARRALAAVGLENRAGEWPAALSGGQKQRVALARALIHRPGLLLLDEPLGALDALTRLEMQDLIVSLWQEHGFTVLLVTHDVSEAVAMADRVLLIEEGKIGLDLTVDIQPTYLTPADARAAFQQGNVDAWAIWDPYYSAALLQGGVRVLKDGTDLNQTGSFYLAARPYAEKNGAFIQGVLATFSEADALTRSQREQSIALLAKTMGLPAPVIASYLDHRPPTTIKPVNAEVAALQQQTADLFYENRLVPKKVDIRQRIWQPTQLEGKQL